MPTIKNNSSTLKPHFSKKEAINFGFKVAKENISFFLSVFVVWALLIIVSQALQFNLKLNKQLLLSFIFSLSMLVVNSIIAMGIINICLKFVDGKKPNLKDIIFTKNLFNFILASIIRNIIIFAGFILFIIPGIIFSIKLQYSEYLIVDKKLDAVSSIKKSWEMTKGVKWNLFLFGVLLGLINILGVLALLLGLLITVPLSLIANTYVYRKLYSQTYPK